MNVIENRSEVKLKKTFIERCEEKALKQNEEYINCLVVCVCVFFLNLFLKKIV